MKTRNTLRSEFIAGNLTLGGLLAVLLCLLPALTRAETGVPTWVQRYNGPGKGNDFARAVAVDASNNVIVTGYSPGGGSGLDYATIKYSSAGLPLWTNRYNGDGEGNENTYANAVAVDGSNNVIVTGTSWGGSGSWSDFATIKYSSAGVPLWTNRYDGPPGNEVDEAAAVAVDGNNNVIVTGHSYGSDSYLDYATIKYSSAGVPLWTNRYNGPANSHDLPRSVAVDTSGNVYVTGASSLTGAPDEDDYATIKYSEAGVPLWTNRYNGTGNGQDGAFAVVVDGSGNVIVTGTSWGGSGSSLDYATIKYSSAGVPLWTNLYNGSSNFVDYAQAIAVDASNNVIVTGYSAGTNVYPYNYDYATVKYSSAGGLLWTKRYNGSGNHWDIARAVVVDGNNNVIVTGYSASTNVSPFNYDYATIKYSSAGVPLWTNRFNGPRFGNNDAIAVAVDRGGNVIVTGSSSNGSNDDYATIQYSIVQPIPLEIQLAGNQLVLTWTNAAFSLQCAPAVTGAFTNMPGATSPCTNPITSAQQYFRLISD